MQLVPFLYLVALIVATVSVILSDRTRFFDKLTWALFVLFIPIIGMAGWFLFGRDRRPLPVAGGYYDSERVDAGDDVIEAELERD